jgi:hypothetical protein
VPYKNTNFYGQVKAFSAKAENYLTDSIKKLTLNMDIIAQHCQKAPLHLDLHAHTPDKPPYNYL